MRSILIHAWTISKVRDDYFLPYTHWIYLNEISKYYKKISLLAPVKLSVSSEGFVSLKAFENIEVIELPFSDSYVSSVKHFFSYVKAYKNLSNYDVTYARYPVPFGWLQKIFFKESIRIIHFVGDPIDATKVNPNFSRLKKAMLISFFMPEHIMYMWACRNAKVYTNGYHLAERLKSYGVESKSLISSTLNAQDFFFEVKKNEIPKIIYVGYLRKAKGVETVLTSFSMLQKKYKEAKLSIVGSGEFETVLKQMVINDKIENVEFYGHIDSREKLNSFLRSHTIFCFASLSEGSPRVILEAMANSLNVVTTPVGSLPQIFEDQKDLLYAKYNDVQDFFDKMTLIVENEDMSSSLRLNAYKKVSNYTVENFIKEIFYEA